MKLPLIGWALILISTFCMYLSMREAGYSASFIWWIFIARLSGISAFGCGVACIFLKKWSHGSLLIICAVVLPIISLFVHSRL